MVGQAAKGPGLDGGGADFGRGQSPELLTKSVDGFIQQGRYRLRRTVTFVEAGAAGNNGGVNLRISNPL